MRTRSWRQWLAVLLTLFMLLGLFPLSASASLAGADLTNLTGEEITRLLELSAEENPVPTFMEPLASLLDGLGLIAPERHTGVDARVMEALSDQREVSVIIRLKEQADLTELNREGQTAGRQAQLHAPPGHGRQAAHTARVGAVVDALQSKAKASQKAVEALLAAEAKRGGVRDVKSYWIFNGFSATVSRDGLSQLAAHPDVASITLDEVFTVPEVQSSPKLPTWGLEKVFAPQVWGEYGFTGEGIVVGVMDSGVDGGHPALAGSYRGRNGDHASSWYVATDENYPTPFDGHGHGTHVTGSIVGGPPGEVIGVAPGAEWIAAKIFRDTGSTSASIIHDAFQWMLAPGGDPAKAPHVVNNSWGSTATYSTEFWEDVAAWVAAGIFPAFANGNEGPGAGTVGSPGSFPHSFGVGATDRNDVIASFSSRGPAYWDGVEVLKPQVSAPGHQIYSAWPRQKGMDYHTISGTSMATPHLSGVVALLLSASPDLTIDQIRHLLESTARWEPHMGTRPNHNYGYGIVDAYAAITAARYSGTLSGTITGPDGPIAATIAIPELSLQTVSDPTTGYYELLVKEGARQAAISAFGYLGQTAQVSITGGERTTLDLQLQPAPSHTVSGTVRSAVGTLADAKIELPGTPLAPVYTDAAGSFSLSVPEGAYSLTAQARGHLRATVAITVDRDLTLDLVLEVTDQTGDPGWSQYQNNPARTGYSAEEIEVSALQRAWQAKISGQVMFSSPVIAGGRIFITTNNGTLHALSLADGRTLWSVGLGANLRATPAVAGGRVFVGGGDSAVFYALDAAGGELLWTFATPGERLTYTAPTVVDGTVYFGTGWGEGNGGNIYALDAATGALKWKRLIGGQIFFAPAVADGMLFAGSHDARRLSALDAGTGELLWSLTRTADAFVSMPVYADGRVYAGTTNFSTGAGSMLAIDAVTGAILWEQAGHGDSAGSTPVIYGDLVIAGSTMNNWVAAYDRMSGQKIWQNQIGAAVSSSQLVTEGGLLIGGSQQDRRAWILDAYTGRLLWEQLLADNVLSAPALADGTLVLADRAGNIYAYTAPGAVTGTVTGPAGPLDGRIRVRETGATVMTDPATGRYSLDHKPGTYTLEFYSYGYKQATATVRIQSGRLAIQDALLEPGAAGALQGVIRDEGGAPLSGVTVSLPETPILPVITGVDGAYAFPEVTEGEYRLEFAKFGYAAAAAAVQIAPGQATAHDLTLLKYEIAVLGDYEGQIAGMLERLGYRVESTTYEAIADRPGDYRLIIANGAKDDPGAEVFTSFVANADAAGVSILFLNTWGVSYGAIRQLTKYTGDPAEIGHNYIAGRVYFKPLLDHPLTAGLPAGAMTEVLGSGADHSWFNGYSGHVLAELHNDKQGRVGYGIGYQARSASSVHVLLPIHAAAPWVHPTKGWLPITRQLFLNAVTYAMEAEFGVVTGQVSTVDDEPLAATVTVLETGEQTTADAAGRYQLFLPAGSYTLRFEKVGYTAQEIPVAVTIGSETRADAALAASGLGALSGLVTSARTSGPLVGATVRLLGTELPEAITGEDGRFRITDLPGGSYTVQVTAPLHLPSTAEVEVADGAEAEQDFHLPAAPRVAVVGDYSVTGNPNVITRFLNENHMTAQAVGWDVMNRLSDFDVLLLNNPTDPGKATFLAYLDQIDQAGVSAIFTDGYLSTTGAGRLLRNHLLDPATRAITGSSEGAINLTALRADHPLFAGLPASFQAFANNTRVTYYDGYSGIPLANLSTGLGLRGMQAGYEARSATGVRVILGGYTASSEAHPYLRWTAEGQQLFLNAVQWAAAPGLSTLTGTVIDPAGEPVAEAALRIVETGQTAVSGADGSFTLYHQAGAYTLSVEAFGFTPQALPVLLAANGTLDLTVELGVGQVGQIAGVVTDRIGQPVAGARITLPGYPNAAVTAEDGSFTLDRLFPGSYTVQVDSDGHVRQLFREQAVTVGETTPLNPVLRPSPKVAVIDDYQHRAKLYLTEWGYEAEDLTWAETSRVGDFDVIIANLASFPYVDPGQAGWEAFQDAVNRAHVPVIWMDQFGRGSIRWLAQYGGDPLVRGEGRSHGGVFVRVLEEHPLLAGFPVGSLVPVTAPTREYGFFTGYSGTAVGALVTETMGERGGSVAYRGRTSASVDILLSTLSISTYGHPATPDLKYWTPEAEQILHNALNWALDAPPMAAEVRGTVLSNAGGTIASRVRVAETGQVYSGRDGDGTFFVPLQPGTWTLEISAFGHRTEVRTVTVTAGQVERPSFTLIKDQVGVIHGKVTDQSGLPLAGALVELEGTPLSAMTDAAGAYRILNIPAGPVEMKVYKHGYTIGRTSFTLAADTEIETNFHLAESIRVAIVGDYQNSLKSFLEENGFLADQHTWTTVQPVIPNYRVLILNGTGGADPGKATFEAVLAAAQAAQVSVILPSQFGSGTINTARLHRGDPVSTTQSFASNGHPIYYRPLEEHPIFRGFPVGQPIPIAQNPPTGSQQYQFFTGYSGTMLAVQGRGDGGDLGGGVAYKFTSARSVELLLGSLASTASYGAPNTRWTDAGRQIYLNAVEWAATARQGEIYGRITADGEPVPGATVTVVEAGLSTRSTLDGTYSIGLGDGTYTVRVAAHGYYPVEQTVILEEFQRLEVNVTLQPMPRGAVAGQVTDAAGSPIAGATVTLAGDGERVVMSGPDGRFGFDRLLEGEYHVSVAAVGYVGGSQTVTVTAHETTQVTFVLHRNDVAVVGDVEGALTRFLRENGIAAEERGYDVAADIAGYAVVVVNGGTPTAAEFQTLLEAADAHSKSLIFTSTWGVNNGAIRWLERYTGDAVIGGQGYREGAVFLTGLAQGHPLFAGLSDPAAILAPESYYSYLSEYVGLPLAMLAVDGRGELGIGAAYDFRSASSIHLLLAAHATTGMIGPELGWTADGERLMLNAIEWARTARQALPAAPVLDEPASPVTIAHEITLSGIAEYRSPVTIYRDGAPVATATPDRAGHFAVTVPLVEGENRFTAVAANFAGESAPSAVVTVLLLSAVYDELPVRAPGNGQVPVKLRLIGADGQVMMVTAATLELYAGDGTLVGSYEMRRQGDHYQANLARLSSGEYRLRAVLEHDGWTLTLPDQILTLR